MEVVCEVCKETFKLEKGNYFVFDIDSVTFKCLYVHKRCKASLAIIDGIWHIHTATETVIHEES